ncbi:hypothetical protein, partial [Streptomyces sp. NRRL WC-3725]|uniref:hypothetical protein n=1 Tax=Streptomyces sp. NRRL WC-3725 TaxID=1463933 RepID=UPI001F326C24
PEPVAQPAAAEERDVGGGQVVAEADQFHQVSSQASLYCARWAVANGRGETVLRPGLTMTFEQWAAQTVTSKAADPRPGLGADVSAGVTAVVQAAVWLPGAWWVRASPWPT